MIVNGKTLLACAPIKDMVSTKMTENGVSYGLTEAGYDIRIKQGIVLSSQNGHRFQLVSSVEEFQMPNNLVGVVHDKSTWARKGIAVQNTVIEPGWRGFLTLEITYHGELEECIFAGSGIAQVLFHRITDPAQYEGKYQGQPDRPVSPIFE